MGGSRPETFKRFMAAVRDEPEVRHILLVDSERPVGAPVKEHLNRLDRWDTSSVSENQCHLMVQAVEAWLVADPEALASYYGRHFQSLPSWQDVEVIDKDVLIKKLEKATAKTQKRRYDKVHHCSDLLRRIDPAKVRKRAKHCDRLFTVLTTEI